MAKLPDLQRRSITASATLKLPVICSDTHAGNYSEYERNAQEKQQPMLRLQEGIDRKKATWKRAFRQVDPLTAASDSKLITSWGSCPCLLIKMHSLTPEASFMTSLSLANQCRTDERAS